MNLLKNLYFSKLKSSLSKTRQSLFLKISASLEKSTSIQESIDEIESILLSSDLGADLVEKLIKSVKSNRQLKNSKSYDELKKIFIEEILKFVISKDDGKVKQSEGLNQTLNVLVIIGINGSGKTTTVAKLAKKYKIEGKKIIIASADTFRAAANEQLRKWINKIDVDFIEAESQDSASVVYKATKKAIDNNCDLVIVDTAGRIQNNKNLMLELSKIVSVLNKLVSADQIKTYITLDANSGQNIVRQVEEFNNFIKINGIIINKIDGTAKGGAVLQISYKLNIPIEFMGIGERIDDLIEFDKESFVSVIFENN